MKRVLLMGVAASALAAALSHVVAVHPAAAQMIIAQAGPQGQPADPKAEEERRKREEQRRHQQQGPPPGAPQQHAPQGPPRAQQQQQPPPGQPPRGPQPGIARPDPRTPPPQGQPPTPQQGFARPAPGGPPPQGQPPTPQQGFARPAPGGPPPQGQPPAPQQGFARPPQPGFQPHGAPINRAPAAAFAPPPGPQRLDQVQHERHERREDGRVIIEEPGRTIVRENNTVIIRHDDAERFRRFAPDVRQEQRPGGVTVNVFSRPGGVQIVTEVDQYGRTLRRYRREPGGRQVLLFENRPRGPGVGTAIGIGVGLGIGAALIALSPPMLHIPQERYIVDYDRASDDDLYEALSAPPVEALERGYTLDEVRYSYGLLDRMRRIDLDNILFDTGAWDISPDQYWKLERVAHVMMRLIERHPDEVFLIEGHTDATGTDEDNLSLSDRRAESVADILTQQFGVPPENLVTQGYGEQHLKIPTQGPEVRNRRVVVRRITPLLARD